MAVRVFKSERGTAPDLISDIRQFGEADLDVPSQPTNRFGVTPPPLHLAALLDMIGVTRLGSRGRRLP